MTHNGSGLALDGAVEDEVKFHPLADIFPLMEGTAFDELVADIKANGLQEDIILFEGKILDGRNRYRACLAAGVPPCPIPGDAWIKDPATYVISANICRRHLNAEQKRDLIARLLKANPERSNNATAKVAKVDDKTVASVRRELEGRSEIPNVEVRADTKGRKQPARKGWRKERYRRHRAKKRGAAEAIATGPSNPLIAAWDTAGRETRHDFIRTRWVELMRARDQISSHAVSEIAEREADDPSDPGDIPECLRRTP
jgi:hypothetical protein